jgi:hypothetical protein
LGEFTTYTKVQKLDMRYIRNTYLREQGGGVKREVYMGKRKQRAAAAAARARAKEGKKARG